MELRRHGRATRLVASELATGCGIANDDRMLAAARTLLRDLLRDPGPGSFDFAFIDADKTGYDGYYARCLKLLRPGGLIGIDNVPWGGDVADPKQRSADTLALRALNKKLHHDERVALSMLPVGDGLTLALKR